jgi:hypothetical protein
LLAHREPKIAHLDAGCPHILFSERKEEAIARGKVAVDKLLSGEVLHALADLQSHHALVRR